MKAIRWLACVLALAILALAMVGLLGLRSAAPVAAGDTLVVDDDGQGSAADCDATVGAYSTIQAAIDAASDGDTISVCPGTYDQDEANGRDPDTGGAGSNDFNIFVGKAVTIQGVDASGAPITDYNNVAAEVIAKRELPTFGQSAIFVQADGVTITGLEVRGWSGTENNKTVEVVGDDFTIKDCVLHGMNSAAALYFDDRHFDSGTSHLQSYDIEENLIDGGGISPSGIRFSNGAGWSGPVSGRVIKDNTFQDNCDAIAFVGPQADPWDKYPVGDATITGNSFSRSDRRHVIAWGEYPVGSGNPGYINLDWQGIVQNNTFDKAAITWTPGGDARSWDSGSFKNVRGIYSAIQRYAIPKAQAGDTVQVLPGTYNEQIVIDTANLTLSGPNAGVDPGCSGTRPNAEATIAWSTNTGVGTASTVVIAANGVTVDGFTIQNTNGLQNQVSVLIGGHYVGDTTRPSDGSAVRNNIISSGYNNVYVWQSSDNTIEQNRVLASVETQISIRDNAGQGTRDALRNSVLNNCIDKAGVTSLGHSVAIGVTGGGAQDFTGTLIQGNTMKNSGTGTGQYRGIDANLANGTVGGPVRIYGNTITDASEGSIRIENSNNYDIGGSSPSTGNTITGSSGTVGGYRRGIGTAGTSTGLSIQYNTISGHSSTSGNDGEIVVTTSGNTVLHNTLFVAGSAPDGSGGIGLRADSWSNVLGENTFQGDGQRMLQVSGAPGPGLTVVDATASTFKTASGTTLDPNSQADLVSIEDRVRHHMDVPGNFVLVIFKASTTVATALNNATTPGAIQRAINAVPGSTVVVGPGTYTGTVNISGRSTLDVVGTDRDTVIVKPASTLSWAIPGYPQYDSRQAAVRVVASTGINFSNMTFDFDTVKGNNVAGVFYWDSTGTLNNNALKNMSVPDASGGYAELTSYIRAPSYTDGARAAVTISNNVFTDTGRLGVVTHDFVQATIQGNTFTKTTDDFGYAIEMGSRSTGTISGNTISGYDTPAASDNSESAGIYIENSFTSGLPHVNKPVTVSGNTLTGNQYGVWIGNEFDGYTGDIDIIVTLQGNTIQNNTDGGVYVVDEDRSAGSSVTLTASGNTVSNNGATGYYFNTYGDGELHATLTGETITGQATGIRVKDSATGSSNSLYDLAVHNSTIGGSTYGINNTVPALVNAENNYWGTLSWYGYDAVSGIKDRVSGNVDWEPWKDSSLTTSYSKPATTYVDDDNVGKSEGQPGSSGGVFGYDAFAVIQDGINNVAGSTVNVADGVYTATSLASIVITKDGLSLIGQSRDGTIIDAGPWGTSGAGWPRGIQVYANDVTIRNFTVRGFTGDTINTGGYGIVFRDWDHDGWPAGEGYIFYHGGIVENVKLENNYSSMYALVHRHLTVRNSLIQNSLADGMFIARESDDATITGNTVLNSGDNGIWVGYDWNALGPSDNAIITDNVVDGAREGGISFVASDTALVSGNDVSHVKGEEPDDGWSRGAINLKDGVSNVIVSYNVVHDNNGLGTGSGRGIGVDGTSSGITITGNIIRANAGGGIKVMDTTSGWLASSNIIYGNTGYGAENTTGVSLDFTHNWWGSCSGPYHPTLNPLGLGDAVSDNVDFAPWITGPCDTDGDGFTDDQENLTYFTNPNDPDTDHDGFFDDGVDVDGPGPGQPNDNCRNVSNPGQENADAAIDNGPDIPGNDITVPNGDPNDTEGDVCETDGDIDNDWMLDTGTNLILGIPGEDVGCGSGPTNALKADTDGDTVVDGAECLLGSDPNNPASKPPAQPSGDSDKDGLPASVEALFGSSDANRDTDGDGISDGVEVKGWATSPTSTDTDGDSSGNDGCQDDKEIVSVNTDKQANILDVQVIARMAFGLLPPHPALDINKDGVNNILDVLLASMNSNLVEAHDVCH
jgi:hypothetical protein